MFLRAAATFWRFLIYDLCHSTAMVRDPPGALRSYATHWDPATEHGRKTRSESCQMSYFEETSSYILYHFVRRIKLSFIWYILIYYWLLQVWIVDRHRIDMIYVYLVFLLPSPSPHKNNVTLDDADGTTKSTKFHTCHATSRHVPAQCHQDSTAYGPTGGWFDRKDCITWPLVIFVGEIFHGKTQTDRWFTLSPHNHGSERKLILEGASFHCICFVYKFAERWIKDVWFPIWEDPTEHPHDAWRMTRGLWKGLWKRRVWLPTYVCLSPHPFLVCNFLTVVPTVPPSEPCWIVIHSFPGCNTSLPQHHWCMILSVLAVLSLQTSLVGSEIIRHVGLPRL